MLTFRSLDNLVQFMTLTGSREQIPETSLPHPCLTQLVDLKFVLNSFLDVSLVRYYMFPLNTYKVLAVLTVCRPPFTLDQKLP